MGNPVVHWELMSKDPAKVSEFYVRIVETGGEGGINGGIVKPDREGPWPGNTLFYILLDERPEGRMMGLWKAAQR